MFVVEIRLMSKIDLEIKSKFKDDKHRFVTNLVFTANWILNEFTKNLKPFGISSQQYNVLRILNASGDWVAMSELKDGLLEKAPNATRLTDKMLAKGLIERNRSEADRRVVFVRISTVGLELFGSINQKESSIQFALDNQISQEDARRVSEVLDKLRG